MIQLAACLSRHLPHLRESRADGELLAAFIAERDEDAFAELVRRHGPLVWAACRRLLPDATDAEDAFQTSFLVLVRRARRLRGRDTIGPWLYQVAVWTARNIRRRNARILAKRKPLGDSAAAPNTTELRTDIDAALAALPEKYRTPLVLCHLQGWSRRDAAERLGCPEGTLSSLLARGLDRLRTKLSGFDPAKALTVAAPAVPMLLANSTVKAAAGMHLAASAAVSAAVHQLVEGVVRMFWIKKATAASVALVAMFGFGIGVGVSVKQVPGAVAGDGPAVASADDRKQLEELVGDERELVEAEALVKAAQAVADEAAKQGQKEKVAEALEKLKAAQRLAALAKLKHDRDAETYAALKLLTQKRADLLAADLDSMTMKLREAEARLKNARRMAAEKGSDPVLEKKLRLEADAIQSERDELAEAVKAHQIQLERLALDAKDVRLKLKLDERIRTQRELDDQIAKLKAEQEQLQAQAAMLAMQRERAQRELALLEAKRAEVAKPGVGFISAASIDLTITKTAMAPFQAVELGADGKPVGTLTFDNFEILRLYLSRTGKDAKAPKTVRLTVQADTKFDLIKQIVEACAAAGLKPPTMLNLGKQKADAKTAEDYVREIELYYKAGNR